MLLSHQIFGLLVQTLDLVVNGCHLEMVLGVVWLGQRLLGEGRNDCLYSDEEVVLGATPFAKLVLGESRVKNALWHERGILVGHLVTLILQL